MEKLVQRPTSMLQVYQLLPEGTPIQLINNRLYMSPAPSVIHFAVIKTIFKAIENFVEKGKLGTVFFAPVDVYLGNVNAVQPDIFFIATEHAHIIEPNGINGAPNFIIEVLSRKKRCTKSLVYKNTLL
jgi:Uma2 family endonuclease